MPIAARHRDDPALVLEPLAALAIERTDDAALLAALQQRPAADLQRRLDEGHRAYVARWNGMPAAWGWVATRAATIGELDARVELPDGERYLWNFVTRPDHRGRGIYPRLLAAILAAEAAERHWIAWAPENHASGAGIRKAGFLPLAELSFDASGQPALHDLVPGGARLATTVLRLRESSHALAPCWRCVRAGRGAMGCVEGRCRCDYQRPDHGCAA